MAEPVGLVSGVIALATFAFQSGTKLYSTIQEFRSHPRQVRELVTELLGLTSVLQKLSETGDLNLDVDLTALRLALEQCRQSCDEVRTELLTYCSKSAGDRASFRDWAKMKCSGGDGIEGFRQQLIGYKSTITIALSFANLRASATTAEALHACRDLIATTTVDLEAHLGDILQKLEDLTQRAAAGPTPDPTVRQRIEEDRRTTQKGLEFCAMLSEAIDQFQLEFFGAERGSLDMQDSDSTSGMLVGEGLDGCRQHIRFTLGQLEKRRSRILKSLETGSAAAVSARDQASLDNLQAEANTLRHCLNFCSNVDAVLESQISTIENDAEGDDTIQFMVSTDGRPINGKNRGVGSRLKQAGGHFSEESLQQVSKDFTTVSIHSGSQDRNPKRPTSTASHDSVSTVPASSFDNRHGPGFTLSTRSTPGGPAAETGV